MTKTQRAEINKRIQAISADMLDAISGLARRIAAPPPPVRQPPAEVGRRQLANILRLSQFCGQKICRRAGCCRGNPQHCLHIALPLMPPEAFKNLARIGRAQTRSKVTPRSPGEIYSTSPSPRPTSAPSRNAAADNRR